MKQFRTFVFSGSLAFKPGCHLSSRLSPLPPPSLPPPLDAKEFLWITRPEADTDPGSMAAPASKHNLHQRRPQPPGGRRLVGRQDLHFLRTKTFR